MYLSYDPQILISRIYSKKCNFKSVVEIGHRLLIKAFYICNS